MCLQNRWGSLVSCGRLLIGIRQAPLGGVATKSSVGFVSIRVGMSPDAARKSARATFLATTGFKKEYPYDSRTL